MRVSRQKVCVSSKKTRQACQIEAYIISNDSVFFGWVVRDWNFWILDREPETAFFIQGKVREMLMWGAPD